jgi:translocation and assembly module TamA
MKHTLFLILFLFCHQLFSLSYEIQFVGVDDPKLIEKFKNGSRFLEGKKEVPHTKNLLEGRASQEKETLLAILQSAAYYEPTVSFQMAEEKADHFKITYYINTGSRYTLESVKIIPEDLELITGVTPAHLCLTLGRPAKPKYLLEGQSILLQKLAERGYPTAYIKELKVVADKKNKTISATYDVEKGPLTYFGPIEIQGLKKVNSLYIWRKIAFYQGALYQPNLIERTQQALDESPLFATVLITPKEDSEEGVVPYVIQVTEAAPRSIGAGLSYSTQRGAGFTVEWEHRNLFGMGEKLSFDANILQMQQEVLLSYTRPDFLSIGQNLILVAEAEYEKTKGFTERFVSLSSLLERKWNPQTTTNLGLSYKQLRTTRSDDDGDYSLFKTPFQIDWNRTDNPLDPTRGYSLFFKTTPTTQLLSPQFFYAINNIIGTTYLPIGSRTVLAFKGNFGTILGSNRQTIPSSERFYAGSENTLRGYNYLTVSPLSENHKPLGGRSMLIANFEMRYRATDKIGLVGFYDAGNVWSAPLPEFDQKILQSAGFGLRYFTPVGPLRFDVAFPLNRRAHVDNPFQLYLSIGQSF